MLRCARESIRNSFIEIGLLQAVNLLSSTGGLELKLNKLIRPCVHPSRCGTKEDPEKISDKKCKFIDLFSTGSKRGWWACYACYDGEKVMKVSVYLYYIF